MDVHGAFFIGFLAGPICYGGVQVKHYFGYDDALDAFGVHAVGGILGSLLTGFFATDQVQRSPAKNGNRSSCYILEVLILVIEVVERVETCHLPFHKVEVGSGYSRDSILVGSAKKNWLVVYI